MRTSASSAHKQPVCITLTRHTPWRGSSAGPSMINARLFPYRSEWATNMHRDSYASYVGHNGMLAYFATAEN
eukprot:COSAG01_NODE_5334_length_4326_cov_144.633073_1_plen_71_part_10